MKKNFHEGHRGRVKKRYIKDRGLDSFEDHQVLELMLFYVYPRKDTNEIAHKMLDKFGNLHNLLEADPAYIMEQCGVTENVAIFVSLIPHLSKRYSTSRWDKKVVLDNTKITGKFATSLFIGKHYECFYVICLDAQLQLINSVLLQEGTVSYANVYIRNVVEVALRHKASSVILAHNHPSGCLKPSEPDKTVTYAIRAALESSDIELIDHIIVGGEKFLSFSEKLFLVIEDK